MQDRLDSTRTQRAFLRVEGVSVTVIATARYMSILLQLVDASGVLWVEQHAS